MKLPIKKATQMMLTSTLAVFVFVQTTVYATKSASEGGQRNGIEYGLISVQGKRQTMEDAHTIQVPLAEIGGALFGVFDGHGTDTAAALASANLPGYFIQSYKLFGYTGPAFTRAFLDLDERINQEEQKIGWAGGTMAVAAYVSPTESSSHILTIANTGDSRAIFCSIQRDGSVATTATIDHNATHLGEYKRLKYSALGTQLLTLQPGGATRLVLPGPPEEIQTRLSIMASGSTRSLGDFSFKNLSRQGHSGPWGNLNQLTIWPAGGHTLIPDPEIYQMPFEAHNFAILACDGLWDMVSNQEASNIAALYMTIQDEEWLRQEAHRLTIELEQQEKRTDESMKEIAKTGGKPYTRITPLLAPLDPTNKCHLAAAALVLLASQRWLSLGSPSSGDNISVLVFRPTTPGAQPEYATQDTNAENESHPHKRRKR